VEGDPVAMIPLDMASHPSTPKEMTHRQKERELQNKFIIGDGYIVCTVQV
jgi:hypothetical protein